MDAAGPFDHPGLEGGVERVDLAVLLHQAAVEPEDGQGGRTHRADREREQGELPPVAVEHVPEGELAEIRVRADAQVKQAVVHRLVVERRAPAGALLARAAGSSAAMASRAAVTRRTSSAGVAEQGGHGPFRVEFGAQLEGEARDLPFLEDAELLHADGAGLGHALERVGCAPCRRVDPAVRGEHHRVVGVAVVETGEEAQRVDGLAVQLPPAGDPAAERARLHGHEPLVAQVGQALQVRPVGPARSPPKVVVGWPGRLRLIRVVMR